jgi:hypothetical protein
MLPVFIAQKRAGRLANLNILFTFAVRLQATIAQLVE